MLAMTSVPVNQSLHPANWARLSPTQRLDALQAMEDRLAAQEGRDPCIVEPIPDHVLQKGDNAETLSGRYIPRPTEEHKGRIQLNPALVEDGQSPYAAVDTYFHEARHAWQDHVTFHPEDAESEQQRDDFYKAKYGGYLNSEDGSLLYACQPTEIDANHTADTRTMLLYEQLGDSDGHTEWRYSEAGESMHPSPVIERAFADEARSLVDAKYRYVQQQLEERTGADNARVEGIETRVPEAGITPEPAHPGTPSQVDAEELGEAAGETAGQAAGEAAAGPAGAAAGEEVGREAGRAAGEAAQEQAEAAGQSTEAPAEAAEEAASDAPAGAPSEEEDRDYDYGYSYGL